MADYDLIRGLIGDRKKAAVNEVMGKGDGTNLYFQLDMFPTTPEPTSTMVLFEAGTKVLAASYTISGEIGRITFVAGSAPAAGAALLVNYEYYALSSGEISEVQSGLTGKPYLAASRAALLIMADHARLFSYTMGDKTVDRTKAAKHLLDLSKRLEDVHFGHRDRASFTGTVFTYKDDTGTPYDSYDSASSYLNNDLS